MFQQGLFGCLSNFGTCLDVLVCTPCQVGYQCNAVKGLSRSMDMCWCLCSVPFCFLVIPWLRCEVVKKYNLSENQCVSCALALLFPVCTLCQLHHEMNFQGTNPGGCCCASSDLRRPMAYQPMQAASPTIVVNNVVAAPPPAPYAAYAPMPPQQHMYPAHPGPQHPGYYAPPQGAPQHHGHYGPPQGYPQHGQMYVPPPPPPPGAMYVPEPLSPQYANGEASCESGVVKDVSPV